MSVETVITPMTMLGWSCRFVAIDSLKSHASRLPTALALRPTKLRPTRRLANPSIKKQTSRCAS